MKRSRACRQLALTALQVFVNHYLSLSWFREYFLLKKIRILTLDDCDDSSDEEDDSSNDEWDYADKVDSLKKREKSQYDLMFLVRKASEENPAVEILFLINNLLDAEEFAKVTTYKMLDPLYLTTEIWIKALNCSDPPLSQLWKKAALQRGNDSLYGKAKIKEMVLNGYYSTESELFKAVNTSPSGRDIIKNWKDADIKLRRRIEQGKSVADKIRYYESTEAKERQKGYLVVADYWKLVIQNERQGISSFVSHSSLLMAWALGRARDHLVSGPVWRIATELFIPNVHKVSELLPFLKMAKLALKVNDLFDSFKDWEKEVFFLRGISDEMTNHPSLLLCKGVLKDLSELFSSKLSSIVAILTCNSGKLTQVKKLVERLIHLCDKGSFLERNRKKVRSVILSKTELLGHFKEFPEIMKVVETKFEEYLNEFINYFQKVIGNLRRTEFSENDDEDDYEAETRIFLSNENRNKEFPLFSLAGQFFIEFPYKAELLFYCKKLESHSNNWLASFNRNFLAVICETISRYYPKKPNPENFSQFEGCLKMVNRLLSQLNHFDSLSFTPELIEIIQGFLDGCFVFLLQGNQLKYSEMQTISKIGAQLFNFIFHGNLNSFKKTKLKVKKWLNYIRLFKKVPEIRDKYFRSLVLKAVIACFTESGKQYDETFIAKALRFYEEEDYFHFYLMLLKLRTNASLIVAVYQKAIQTAVDSLDASMVKAVIILAEETFRKSWIGNEIESAWSRLAVAYVAVINNCRSLFYEWKAIMEFYSRNTVS
jgi:hypothetical protein